MHETNNSEENRHFAYTRLQVVKVMISEISAHAKKRRFACTTHSFFLPGQLGPGYIFGKSQFCEAFCNNHFKKSRLACTEDHFMVTGRTNLRTQTAQWLFESSGSAYTRRDFSTKSIVSRARDCHLLGSRILRIPPAEWIRDPWIPRAWPQPAQRPSHK